MKIKTPFQFTIFTSISCAIFMNLCVFLIFEKLYGYDIMLSVYLLVFLAVTVFVGVLIYLLLESFIINPISDIISLESPTFVATGKSLQSIPSANTLEKPSPNLEGRTIISPIL